MSDLHEAVLGLAQDVQRLQHQLDELGEQIDRALRRLELLEESQRYLVDIVDRVS